VLSGVRTPLNPRVLARRYICQVYQVPKRNTPPPQFFEPATGFSSTVLTYRLHEPQTGDLALYDSMWGTTGVVPWFPRNQRELPGSRGRPSGDGCGHGADRSGAMAILSRNCTIPRETVWPQTTKEMLVGPGSVRLLVDGMFVPGIVPRSRLRGQIVAICWPPPRMRELRQSGGGKTPGPPTVPLQGGPAQKAG